MKRLLVIFAIFALVLAPAFTQGSQEATEKSVELKLGFQAQANSNEFKAAELFAKEASELSNGTINIEIFPGGQLGDDRSMLDQVAAGAMDMVFAETGRFGLWLPEAEIFGYPFSFDSFDHLLATMDTEYGKDLKNRLIENGWRILANGYNGTRQTTSNFPINSIEDMAGMKLRVPNAQSTLDFAKYAGASPTPLAFAEVYLALKTNAVDGQENPLSTINAQKFYEVQKYLALTGHIINDNNYVISEIVFDKLSPAQQEAIIAAAEKAAAYHTELFVNDETKLVAEFEKYGLTITSPERAPFRAAAEPMFDAYIAKYGDAAVNAINSTR